MESLDFQCVKGSENTELSHTSDSNYPDINREIHVIALFTSTPGFSEEIVDIMLTLGLHHKKKIFHLYYASTNKQATMKTAKIKALTVNVQISSCLNMCYENL